MLIALSCSGGGDKDDTTTIPGSSDTTSTGQLIISSDQTDACHLHTAGDVQELFGTPVEQITEFPFELPSNFLRCGYKEIDGRRNTDVIVRIDHTLDGFLEQVDGNRTFTEPESVDGIAQQAFWVAGGWNQLMLFEDGTTITLKIDVDALNAQGQLLENLRLASIDLGGRIVRRLRGELEDTGQESGVTESVLSFDDNLLDRVAAGEWTLGEGLVASLELLLGRRDSDEVLSSPNVVSLESTGVIEMAYEYLEDGTDREFQQQVRALLDELIFTPEQLDSMVITRSATDARTGTANIPVAFMTASEEDCDRFYRGWNISGAPDECLERRSINVGPNTFWVYWPALDEPETGWTDRHLDLVVETIDETVESTFLRLGKMPINVYIVMSAARNSKALANAIDVEGTSDCTVTMFPKSSESGGLSTYSDGDFKQTLAHEFGHCFQNATLTAQQLRYQVRKWREEGLAEYLSDVAYPTNNFESRFATELGKEEIHTATVNSRDYTNYLWFAFWSDALGGDASLLEVLRTGPTSGDIEAQQSFLESIPGIDILHHAFAEAMLDGQVKDRSGGPWSVKNTLSGLAPLFVPQTFAISGDFEPFGTAKWEVAVPEGTTVTVRWEGEGVTATTRPIDKPGGWQELSQEHEFKAECDEDLHMYFVFTSVTDPGAFVVDVIDVEEGDCPDDAEPEKLLTVAGFDTCVAGTWAADMGLFRRSLTEKLTTGVNVVSLTGEILITFTPDGEVRYDVAELGLEYLAPFDGEPDRLHVKLEWSGVGTGVWAADGSKLQIIPRGFDTVVTQETSFDGSPPIRGSGELAEGLLEGALDAPENDYVCTNQALEIAGFTVDGEDAIWQRQ